MYNFTFLKINKSSIFHAFKKYFLKKILNFLYKLIIFFPYIWFLIFFFFPCLTILKISLSHQVENIIPPYTNLITWYNKELNIIFNFKNYFYIIKEYLYIKIYLESIKLALFTTIISFFISYPIALAIFKIKSAIKHIFLFLIILPSWLSFLMRIYSLVRSMDNNGIINNFLLGAKIINTPINILYTNTAIYISMVYCYFSLMILPIYTSMLNINHLLIDAALDLGAKPLKVFFKIIFPLTKNGIISGAIFVFITSFGEYVIPEMLGGSQNIMIGRILWQEFFNNRDWPMACALSIITIVLLIIPIIYLNKYQKKCNF